MNLLDPKNCNKAKCKTCIFGPTPLELSPGRMDEIRNYLITMRKSHICHTTDKTCYGALELQARTLYILELIPENSVDSMLIQAQKVLLKSGK